MNNANAEWWSTVCRRILNRQVNDTGAKYGTRTTTNKKLLVDSQKNALWLRSS